jgi:hypothetical protein
VRTAVITAAIAALLAVVNVAAAAGDAQAAGTTVVNGFAGGVTAPNDGDVLAILQSRDNNSLSPMVAVDVPHGSTAWGPDLRVQGSNGNTAQHFKFVKRGEWFQLRPLSGNDQLCLEATGAAPFEGQVVQQYGCDPNYYNQPNQLWQVLPTSGGLLFRSQMPGSWYITVSTVGHTTGDSVANLPLVMTGNPAADAHFSLHRPHTTVEKWVNNMIVGGASINNVYCPDPYFIKEDQENSSGSSNVDPTYNRIGDSGVRIYAENEVPSAAYLPRTGARFAFNNIGIPAQRRNGGVRLYCNLIEDSSGAVV